MSEPLRLGFGANIPKLYPEDRITIILILFNKMVPHS